MHHLWKRLLQSRRGATAVEYGIILAFIAAAMIVALQSLNTKTGNLFGNATNALR